MKCREPLETKITGRPEICDRRDDKMAVATQPFGVPAFYTDVIFPHHHPTRFH